MCGNACMCVANHARLSENTPNQKAKQKTRSRAHARESLFFIPQPTDCVCECVWLTIILNWFFAINVVCCSSSSHRHRYIPPSQKLPLELTLPPSKHHTLLLPLSAYFNSQFFIFSADVTIKTILFSYKLQRVVSIHTHRHTDTLLPGLLLFVMSNHQNPLQLHNALVSR